MKTSFQDVFLQNGLSRALPRLAAALLFILLVVQPGCQAPIGADKSTPALAYEQTHNDPVAQGGMSYETRAVLRRFGQERVFQESPEAALRLLHQKAVENRERGLLFALSELNYLTGESLRHEVKPWEPRDARDYYLASAVYAWLFLFGDAVDAPPGPFDERLGSACDLYNYSLGWSLTGRRATNAVAILAGGDRRMPTGRIEVELNTNNFPPPLSGFDRFILADHYLVRGLTMRNRQRGLGATLVGVTQPNQRTTLSRTVPATVFLRVHGGLADLGKGELKGSLEVYSAYDENVVQVNGTPVPLATDTTIAMAYALNQAMVWSLGMSQFLSYQERIPTDVYLTQPYRRGRIPVVFVHGTFSSPVWWAEMINTLEADPQLRQRFQFWYYIYNSGNPLVTSARRLRESLTAKLKELDPEGNDAALQQMVVIGHSQGGLLTKLTATDTGDKLFNLLVQTNESGGEEITPEEMDIVREYTVYRALPFVKRVVFIATPHRGSYAAGNLVRNIARKLVTLPSTLVDRTREFTGLKEKLNLPKELRGTSTSLDGMSTNNTILRTLADIPLAPGIKGHSIIAYQGDDDYHQGKDGLVSYDSAHVDYVESEFIVNSFHSCQGKPETIEEVRRILHEHLAALPAQFAVKPDNPIIHP